MIGMISGGTYRQGRMPYRLSTSGQLRRQASLFESAKYHKCIRVAYVAANHIVPMIFTEKMTRESKNSALQYFISDEFLTRFK